MIHEISNPLVRLESCYHIKDKRKEKVRFKLNSLQLEIKETLLDLRRRSKPLRLIILKPRQVGCTTFLSLLFLDKVYWSQNQFYILIAHKEKNIGLSIAWILSYCFSKISNTSLKVTLIAAKAAKMSKAITNYRF